MQEDNLIIRGDLNFYLAHSEPYGNRAQTDPLTAYFEYMMDSYNLMNIDSTKILSTWINRITR